MSETYVILMQDAAGLQRKIPINTLGLSYDQVLKYRDNLKRLCPTCTYSIRFMPIAQSFAVLAEAADED